MRRHKICGKYHYFISFNCFFTSIVMEYANHGDVFQKINRHKEIGTYIKERLIWKIVIQAVFGL